ncbi:secreted RxLR effector protein 161-like [Cryptomeria japonica]|uniref:secreted RxLR effector protein 161-like n=1 Tax=Cryptomeria japonica TaxID=3369 RepID=UPI0027DA3BA7|nr:secreted RxLR effector protein 161-like [Cryptomeria japonica]
MKKFHEDAATSDLVEPTRYRQLIGSLMYLVNTRPDICYAVNTLSQFMCEPRHIHLVAAKHILRYVHGTIALGLKFSSCVELNLQGFSDSDWAGCVNDRKSTSGCCFSLGSAMISWCSSKQSCVAQSIAEAEYVAACVASEITCRLVWIAFGTYCDYV